MRKPDSALLTVSLSLLLLALFLFLASRPGPGALERENPFWIGLTGTLSDLNEAKAQWAEKEHKSERDVATMQDLAPYLGDRTNDIQYFVSLGIEYKLTPYLESELPSDVATLTRDVEFKAGFRRFYSAGQRFTAHGFKPPASDQRSWRYFYFWYRKRLAMVSLLVGIAILVVFLVRKIRPLRKPSVTA